MGHESTQTAPCRAGVCDIHTKGTVGKTNGDLGVKAEVGGGLILRAYLGKRTLLPKNPKSLTSGKHRTRDPTEKH